jgi:hypothetical protein
MVSGFKRRAAEAVKTNQAAFAGDDEARPLGRSLGGLPLVFPRESHFVILSFPGMRECKLYFPGIPVIPGIDFYLIKVEKGHILRNKMQY